MVNAYQMMHLLTHRIVNYNLGIELPYVRLVELRVNENADSSMGLLPDT